MAYDIAKIRADFPLLGRKVYGRELAYLDNGATAQKPLQVIEKIDYLHRELNANVHRGLHYLSEECTSEYEAAREQVRALIGAASVREIVFTAGATAAINTVAYSFGEKYIHAGDNVITTEMEHHANIVPWQLICERKGAELRVVPFDDAGRLMTEKLPELLDERTRIVCITQASNVLGTRPDLSPVIDLAHRAGVPVLVDGCQGIVHGGVDVQALDCDFYAVNQQPNPGTIPCICLQWFDLYQLQRFRVARIILACLLQHSDPAAGTFVRKFLQFAVFLNRQAAVPIF